jgi:hypothetical protein
MNPIANLLSAGINVYVVVCAVHSIIIRQELAAWKCHVGATVAPRWRKNQKRLCRFFNRLAILAVCLWVFFAPRWRLKTATVALALFFFCIRFDEMKHFCHPAWFGASKIFVVFLQQCRVEQAIKGMQHQIKLVGLFV